MVYNQKEFETLLERTKDEQFNGSESVRKVEEYAKNTAPSSLFRFRKCSERSFEEILNDKMGFSKAAVFNDPFDSMVFSDKKYIDSQVKQGFTNVKLYDAFEDSAIKEIIGEQQKLSEKQIQEEIDIMYPETMEMIQNYGLISCLTENINSQLMWAHYGDSHKGFAVEYKKPDILSLLGTEVVDGMTTTKTIYPVVYTSKRYDATDAASSVIIYRLMAEKGMKNYPRLQDALAFSKVMIYKAKEWSYEKEWRLFYTTDDRSIQELSFYSILCKPSALYLGCKISKTNEYLLQMIAEKKEIPIKKMKMAYDSFDYRIEIE